jgi:hypothetical protein
MISALQGGVDERLKLEHKGQKEKSGKRGKTFARLNPLFDYQTLLSIQINIIKGIISTIISILGTE